MKTRWMRWFPGYLSLALCRSRFILQINEPNCRTSKLRCILFRKESLMNLRRSWWRKQKLGSLKILLILKFNKGLRLALVQRLKGRLPGRLKFPELNGFGILCMQDTSWSCWNLCFKSQSLPT